MNTEQLIIEAKARFNLNSAKQYLKEKYESKLQVAEQDGLWKADIQTISFLSSFDTTTLVVVDIFGNPVLVNRKELLDKLSLVYQSVTSEWYNEFSSLENRR
jgi:hypothetical protein